MLPSAAGRPVGLSKTQSASTYGRNSGLGSMKESVISCTRILRGPNRQREIEHQHEARECSTALPLEIQKGKAWIPNHSRRASTRRDASERRAEQPTTSRLCPRRGDIVETVLTRGNASDSSCRSAYCS